MNTQPEKPSRKTNRLAIISLIPGIIGLIPIVRGLYLWWITAHTYHPAVDYYQFGCCFASMWIIPGSVLGLGGLIIGIKAYREIQEKDEIEKGKALAITGIVLGILAQCSYFIAIIISMLIP